ncbi:hypothetical protein HKX48_001249 [Thoreauomyces humboldtii]|nr:hypothetical protein HKX48_001249 [Thoreauomyces humboldtii]
MFAKTLMIAAIVASTVSAQCVDTAVPLDPTSSAFGGLSLTADGSNWAVTPVDANSYIAVHFNAAKCQSLSAWSGVTFNVTAPASGTFNIAWTIRDSGCVAATGNKTYVPAAKYISNGVATIPFSDFPAVDFAHVEDLTLIGFAPATAGWDMSNVELKCGSLPAPTSASAAAPMGTAAGSAPAAATSGAAAAVGTNATTPSQKSSAATTSAFGLGAVAAAVAALVL